MIKHANASAFVFCEFPRGWRLGLIEHPRLRKRMIVGGHVESDETQAEAAARALFSCIASITAAAESGDVARCGCCRRPGWAEPAVTEPWWPRRIHRCPGRLSRARR